ncbi:hypothetical protein BJY52DRAFT_462370 [Lactarius psammicola]|nr:hypothetical protein BJY52DRAFT_462370 [Lactarius psammicola]
MGPVRKFPRAGTVCWPWVSLSSSAISIIFTSTPHVVLGSATPLSRASSSSRSRRSCSRRNVSPTYVCPRMAREPENMLCARSAARCSLTSSLLIPHLSHSGSTTLGQGSWIEVSSPHCSSRLVRPEAMVKRALLSSWSHTVRGNVAMRHLRAAGGVSRVLLTMDAVCFAHESISSWPGASQVLSPIGAVTYRRWPPLLISRGVSRRRSNTDASWTRPHPAVSLSTIEEEPRRGNMTTVLSRRGSRLSIEMKL